MRCWKRPTWLICWSPLVHEVSRLHELPKKKTTTKKTTKKQSSKKTQCATTEIDTLATALYVRADDLLKASPD